jgi:hypothetical protein
MLKQAARRSVEFFYVDVGFRNIYFCAVVTATVALSKDHCILRPLNAIPAKGLSKLIMSKHWHRAA